MESENTSSDCSVIDSSLNVHRGLWIILMCLYVVISILIIFGNACVIVVYVRSPKVKKVPFNVYILHLAISDFTVGIVIILYHVVGFFWPTIVFVNYVTFYTIHYLINVLPMVSVILVIVMSSDRYQLISNPAKYHQTKSPRTNQKIAISAWIFSGVYSAFLLVLRVYFYFLNIRSCGIHYPYLITYVSGNIVIPSAILVAINSLVICKLRNHFSAMESTWKTATITFARKHSKNDYNNKGKYVVNGISEEKTNENEIIGISPKSCKYQPVYPKVLEETPSKDVSQECVASSKPEKLVLDSNTSMSENQIKARNSKLGNAGKATRNLLLFVLVYFCCWAPNNLYYLVRSLLGLALPSYFDIWRGIFTLLVYFNSVVNPILYGVMSVHYRKAMIALLCGRREARGPLGREGDLNTVSKFTDTTATDDVNWNSSLVVSTNHFLNVEKSRTKLFWSINLILQIFSYFYYRSLRWCFEIKYWIIKVNQRVTQHVLKQFSSWKYRHRIVERNSCVAILG